MRKIYAHNNRYYREQKYSKMTDEELKNRYLLLRSLNEHYFNKKELGQLIGFITKSNKEYIL